MTGPEPSRAMTAEPDLRRPAAFLDYNRSLACIHCGLCLSACPTYLETGNENDSPRGRIYLMRAIQDGRLALNDASVRHLDLCLGCRACETACPSGVEYGALLEGTREFVEQTHRRSWGQRFLRRIAIEKIFPHPGRFKMALWPAILLRRLRLDRVLPRFAREALSLIPLRTDSTPLPAFSPAKGERRGRVGLIRGCVMSVLFGETHRSTVQLLNEAGFDVWAPESQGCCGALFAHGGNLDEARACARRNIAAFEAERLEAIVINAAGCGSTLKEYGHLLHDDPGWADRAKVFSARVKDFSEWLSASGFQPARRGGAGKVTCHEACHLVHAQRISREPRALVRAAAGDRFVDLPEADFCCGSAGSYNLTEPAMAERLQRRKIENILKTGAETVVTTNPGCILQIRAGLEKAGASHVRVVHVSDYLAG